MDRPDFWFLEVWVCEMAKTRGLTARDRATSYHVATSPSKCIRKVRYQKKCYTPLEKKEWENATCPVCLEYPHNAVLLLCSSHHKGCRPFMCATSNRYSNCLEQYKEAYTKVTEAPYLEQQDGSTGNLVSNSGFVRSNEKKEVLELLCPLCRGQVKGWTVIEKARKYFNFKKRTCLQNCCSFVGNFKELRKHVRSEHPLARPRAVDPVLDEKWKTLEQETERNDVISTIVSSIPGAVVVGDYVIEPSQRSFNRDNAENDFFVNLGQNGYEMGAPIPASFAFAPGRSFSQILLGRSRRPHRHR